MTSRGPVHRLFRRGVEKRGVPKPPPLEQKKGEGVGSHIKKRTVVVFSIQVGLERGKGWKSPGEDHPPAGYATWVAHVGGGGKNCF